MTQADLWSEDFWADPYPAYAQLREEAPVYRATTGPKGLEVWLVTRYEDARAALADPRLSKHPRNAPEWMRDFGIVTADGEGPLGVNMLSSDEPDHTRLRKLVARAFTRRRIEALRPRVQEITDTLIDAMSRQEQEEVDLITSLAFPLPVTVICELLGVPLRHRDDFRAWTREATSPPLTQDGRGLRRQAEGNLERYISDLITDIRSHIDPTIALDEQPDLVSALIVAADEHDRLTERELLGMIQLLLVAGHETTVNLIGNGMLALLRQPDQLELVRSRPALLPSAIEELLRYDGPVERATARYATQDVELAGVTIPAGSFVSVVLAAADRDPTHTLDTNRLDVTRTDQNHLAFDHGIHYCLGAPLARLEGQVAIGTLLQRFPNISLTVQPDRQSHQLRWRPKGPISIIRGLEALPVHLRPTAR